MKTKNLLLSFAVAIMAMGCNSGSTTQTSAPLKTTADTVSFYYGYLMGSQMQDIFKVNVSALVAGMNSAIQEKKVDVDPREMDMFINNFMQKEYMKKVEENLTKGKEFMEKNAKKSGVDTLPGGNGVQYKVIKAGTGEKPAATDMVEVRYTGKHIDGKVFDSNAESAEPARFQVNQVIPGWTAALQQMPVGSKWELYIPSEMGYGPRPYGSIMPNSTLVFEVELLNIVKPDSTATEK
ncbi:MAG: FKBP-type peptidyl-prolyl cis-trans isomerase [Odoribacter splanchnicus]|nr:FKBP-type peptidyl-prolyl cis-trans isomerase [Odoribacter splanchnicus]